MKQVLIINGPNLNLLGKRQPEIYGSITLEEIEQIVSEEAKSLNFSVAFTQSNSETEIIEAIQASPLKYAAIIINAAAYSHTSVAIMDALLACNLPVVEVHLSNIYKREEFRHTSYVSKAAKGVICGFGAESYRLAVLSLSKILK